MERVVVVWQDAADLGSHLSATEVKQEKPPRVVSTGWLVEETEDKIIFCSDVYSDDTDYISGVQIIPKGMVLDISYD